MRISWNDYVTLRLNKQGQELWESYWRSGGVEPAELGPERTVKMELWRAAKIFGLVFRSMTLPFPDAFMELEQSNSRREHG